MDIIEKIILSKKCIEKISLEMKNVKENEEDDDELSIDEKINDIEHRLRYLDEKFKRGIQEIISKVPSLSEEDERKRKNKNNINM